MTHRVGCVRAASLPGAGGPRSISLARNTPIAAAVLRALSAGSWRCQLEGLDFAPSCRAQEPAGCAGGKHCQLGCRRHTLSPPTCWPRAGQSRSSTCPFWAVLSWMHIGSSVLPRGPGPAQAGLHVPAVGGARSTPRVSCHLTGLSSLVHPLEVALRCNSHRARRCGLVRGHRGKELRMAAGWPRGTGPAPGRASLLPRGYPGAPPTPSRGLKVAETQMLSLPEVPDPPP